MGPATDAAAAGREIAAVWARYPDELEVGAALAFRRLMLLDYVGARTIADELLAREPDLGIAWLLRARSYAEVGDAAGAVESYVKCSDVATTAIECLSELAVIYGLDGRCAEMEGIGRRMVTVAPDSAVSYHVLASAIFGVTESVEATRGALMQRWGHTEPGPQRDWVRLADEETLAVLGGDFAAALSTLAKMEKLSATFGGEAEHALPLEWRMDLQRETNDLVGLQGTAQRLLETQRAFRTGDHLERDIYAAGGLYYAHGIAQKDFIARRDAWVERSRSKSHVSDADRWMAAYAEPAQTREDAEEAIRVMPPIGPFEGLLTRDEASDFSLGNVFRLADRPAEAAHFFERSAKTCSLSYPIHRTWSRLHQGMLRESEKNVDAACEAYRGVVRAWGREPRSTSAASARKRMRELSCAWIP
jgi:tetratricopeptide (TPR) repeat protein